jgi:hypothetical protein
MSWDENKRRHPSGSKVNDPENTRKARQPTGTGNAATARIARGLGSGDTREARDRLRLADWRDDPDADRLLERVEAGDDFGGTLQPHAEDRAGAAQRHQAQGGGGAPALRRRRRRMTTTTNSPDMAQRRSARWRYPGFSGWNVSSSRTVERRRTRVPGSGSCMATRPCTGGGWSTSRCTSGRRPTRTSVRRAAPIGSPVTSGTATLRGRPFGRSRKVTSFATPPQSIRGMCPCCPSGPCRRAQQVEEVQVA